MTLEDDVLAEAKARRERLTSPPGGHTSTELDIVSVPAARALAIARLEAEAEDKQWTAEQRRAETVAAREQRHYVRYLVTVGRSFDRAEKWPKIERIQRAVCEHYGVGRAELLSQRRHAHIVRPRQVAIYLAKILTFKTWPEIGRRFNNRDHTTCLHAYNRIAVQMASDAKLAAEIAHIRRMLEVG